MARKVGDTVTEYFSLAGEVELETFTITDAIKGGGLAWAGPTITEEAFGEYVLTYVGDAPGVWKATITGNTTGQVFQHSEAFTAASTRSFTRRAAGQVISHTHVNELQQAIEDLSH